MYADNIESTSLKIIEKTRIELKQIELISSEYAVKERISKLIELIEQETEDNKLFLSELIKDKIRETRGVNSALNTNFYLLYRKFLSSKITIQEAKSSYEMYVKEFENL